MKTLFPLIGVGDSCLDIINIMVKLTAQDDGPEFFTHAHQFFEINLLDDTQTDCMIFGEQDCNLISIENFHRVRYGVANCRSQGDVTQRLGFSVGQPRPF